jgi:hypothetical protein
MLTALKSKTDMNAAPQASSSASFASLRRSLPAFRDAGFPGDPPDREAIWGARTREAMDGVLVSGLAGVLLEGGGLSEAALIR